MVQTFQVNPVDYPPELTQGLDDYLTTADTMLPTPPPGDFQTSRKGDASSSAMTDRTAASYTPTNPGAGTWGR